jgi:DNA invertase Pin-like site-specific DNA recombinase
VKRCAVYARYSSDLQSSTSIADQLRLCEAFAERQSWTVVARFEDAALSGFGVEHRPGYRALVAAALQSPPPFDLILVEDVSRLTRDLSEVLRLYHRLRLKGVDLVGVSDGVSTVNQSGKVTLTVKGLVNELYLDDLRAKTHRGLEGRVARGMSAGGRLFGYRTVSVPEEAHAGKRGAPARFEIDDSEAEIVRGIFRSYAAGQSMKAIAHRLNADAVPFPAKDTKRGPARRGWAVSTIYTILLNEKYVGAWVWNKTRFLKDPDSGRRRPVPRPPTEWIRQDRPELRIVDDELSRAVQSRLRQIRQGFGRPGAPPVGGARPMYSRYLLTGLLRCAVCGARMRAQTAVKRKRGHIYRAGWYRCSFAADKGPAVCTHRVWYRQDRLEGSVIAKFREAMTPPIIAALTLAVNAEVDAAARVHDDRSRELKSEILRLEREAGNLVRFLAGGDSFSVRIELQSIEAGLQGLRLELSALEQEAGLTLPRASSGWTRARLEHLDDLLRDDAQRARLEVLKHLDGDLTIRPLPSEAKRDTAHPFEILGRIKHDSLLAVNQEAACGTLVAGAGFEPATFGL